MFGCHRLAAVAHHGQGFPHQGRGVGQGVRWGLFQGQDDRLQVSGGEDTACPQVTGGHHHNRGRLFLGPEGQGEQGKGGDGEKDGDDRVFGHWLLLWVGGK